MREFPKDKYLRVVSTVAGFRRGGIAHNSEPVLHNPADFDPEQIQQMLDEPKLVTDWVDDPNGKPAKATPKPKPAA